MQLNNIYIISKQITVPRCFSFNDKYGEPNALYFHASLHLLLPGLQQVYDNCIRCEVLNIAIVLISEQQNDNNQILLTITINLIYRYRAFRKTPVSAI